jgi:methyl-accepting chemotaxis protein
MGVARTISAQPLLKRMRHASCWNRRSTRRRALIIQNWSTCCILPPLTVCNASNARLIENQKHALNSVADSQWSAYKQLQDQVLTQLHDPNVQYATVYALLYQANLKFLTLQKSWQTVVDSATTVGQAMTVLARTETMPIIVVTIIALLLVIAVIVLTGFIVNITISQRLRRLAQLTRRIGRGGTSERAEVQGRDEIAVVSSSINAMLDNIVNLIGEARNRRVQLEQQINILVDEVSGIGQGDLAIQASITADSLGVLAQAFNYTIKQLGALVINFKTLANEVERATLQTYDDMMKVTNDAERQLQHINQVASHMEDMAQASRYVAERIRLLTKVGEEAQLAVTSGRGAISNVVTGIGRINDNVRSTSLRIHELTESSHQIVDIVKIIADIAQQTNRLALDASIQAAMAGENGRAFRAVAENIRRSADSAREQTLGVERTVRQVLESIQAVYIAMRDTEQETTLGIRSSQDAGKAFAIIFEIAQRQAREMETIRQASEQQQQIATVVAQTVQNVSTTTVQSNQSLRIEAARLENVAQLAERLLSSAEVFKLSEDQDIFAQSTGSNAPLLPRTGQLG